MRVFACVSAGPKLQARDEGLADVLPCRSVTARLKVNTPPRLRVSTSAHHVSALESGRCRQMFPPPSTRQSCAILICWVSTFSVPAKAGRQTSQPGVSLLEATKVSVDCLECPLSLLTQNVQRFQRKGFFVSVWIYCFGFFSFVCKLFVKEMRNQKKKMGC